MFRVSCRKGGTPKQAAGIVKDMVSLDGMRIPSLTMYVEFKNRDGEFVSLPEYECRQSTIYFSSGISSESVESRLNDIIKKNDIEMASVVFCFQVANRAGRLCLLCNDVGLEIHSLELKSMGEGILTKFFVDNPDYRFMSNKEMVLRDKAAKTVCNSVKPNKNARLELFVRNGDLFVGEFVKKSKKWTLKRDVAFPRDMFQGVLFECMVKEGVALSEKLEVALANKAPASILEKLQERNAEMSRVFLRVFPNAEKFMESSPYLNGHAASNS